MIRSWRATLPSLAIIAMLSVACNGITTATTTTVVPTAPVETNATTTTEAAPTTTTANIDGLSLAVAAIDIWNSGDFDAWLALLEPDDDDHLFARSVMNSNERIELTGDCEVTSEPDPLVVTCPIFVEDDFHGAGGLTSNGTITFEFSAEGLVAGVDQDTYQDATGRCCPDWQDYHKTFHTWLAEAHPDVYAQIGPEHIEARWQLPGYAGGDADHMLIALQYVDEFVAETKGYPLPSP